MRGFLTRRLLRTERVCQVIETIRESLVCALEMRNEQRLELNDLQLHDRLIQQVCTIIQLQHDCILFIQIAYRTRRENPFLLCVLTF